MKTLHHLVMVVPSKVLSHDFSIWNWHPSNLDVHTSRTFVERFSSKFCKWIGHSSDEGYCRQVSPPSASHVMSCQCLGGILAFFSSVAHGCLREVSSYSDWLINTSETRLFYSNTLIVRRSQRFNRRCLKLEANSCTCYKIQLNAALYCQI